MALTIQEKKELFEELKRKLQQSMEIPVELCREDVSLPEYARDGDAGMDVRAALDCFIRPGETVFILTGLKMAIPLGFEIQVRPRSGLSFKTPLRVANATGTIDSGFRDEIGIIFHNSSSKYLTEGDNDYPVYTIDEAGNKEGIYHIRKGDRIAQLVLNKIEQIEFIPVQSGTVKTIGINRGGGFGHTGSK
jgi:dUTP pyrophosphatase